jgi:hypothetical protein
VYLSGEELFLMPWNGEICSKKILSAPPSGRLINIWWNGAKNYAHVSYQVPTLSHLVKMQNMSTILLTHARGKKKRTEREREKNGRCKHEKRIWWLIQVPTQGPDEKEKPRKKEQGSFWCFDYAATRLIVQQQQQQQRAYHYMAVKKASSV